MPIQPASWEYLLVYFDAQCKGMTVSHVNLQSWTRNIIIASQISEVICELEFSIQLLLDDAMRSAFQELLMYVILTAGRQIVTVGCISRSISGLEVYVLDSAMVDVHLKLERIRDEMLLAARLSTGSCNVLPIAYDRKHFARHKCFIMNPSWSMYLKCTLVNMHRKLLICVGQTEETQFRLPALPRASILLDVNAMVSLCPG